MASIYLKFEGKGATADLEGAVERKTYAKTIAIDSFTISAAHGGGAPSLSTTDAVRTGDSAPGDVTIEKSAGQESPGLFTACLEGTIIGKATLTMDGASADDVVSPIYTVVLEPCVISKVSQSVMAGAGISETLGLSYDKITITHNPSKKISKYQRSTATTK